MVTAYRDAPAYAISEAARYLRLPPATLRSWVSGRRYATSAGGRRFEPLIRPVKARPPTLSFNNLIEAHVLRSLRSDHGVSVKALRTAIDYAQKQLGLDRLLLRQELRFDAGRIFLDRYGQLIDLSASGQLAMRRVLEEHLKRVEWGTSQFPIRLYPFVLDASVNEAHPIVIDPNIAFGRPVMSKLGISTAVIADRIDSGESPDDVAADYDLVVADVEMAAVYERAH